MLRSIEPGAFDINEIDVSTGTAPIHIACALGDMVKQIMITIIFVYGLLHRGLFLHCWMGWMG